MVAIIIIFVFKFPTIQIVIIIWCYYYHQYFFLLAPLLSILVPSNIIIDFIAVTMIEDSISPLTAKSKPKKISPHNNITIQI